MLRWNETPDQVFQAIVHDCLESIRDMIEAYDHAEEPTEGEREARHIEYRDEFPRLARYFAGRQAVALLKTLLKASQDDGTLYQLTDYHWLLLYESLRVYAEIENDHARISGMPIRCGPYRIGRLDFEEIVDYYFWDTDFMIPALATMPEDARRQMGVSPETWGLACGLTPHPDELEIEPLGPGDEPRHPRPWPRGKRLLAYPPRTWPR
jgi:hypothetical protein